MAKTVTLTDHEGREAAVSSPLLVNQLVYGRGHRLPDGMSVDDAIAYLNAEDEAPADEPEPPAPLVLKKRGKETTGDDAGDSNTD